MDFMNLSFWLWSLAVLACVFMLLSAYSTLSYLWRLPERMPKIKGSMLLRHGDLELLNRPPRKLTAEQIAKMLIIPLVAGLLIGYGAGTWSKYSREYAAWQARSADYQKAYAAWATRQPKETK